MKLVIRINLDNDAFQQGGEVERILRDMADQIRDEGLIKGTIFDINGNRVGSVSRG